MKSYNVQAPGSSSSPEPRFSDQVHRVVAQIPKGKVTSYGAIARALGYPRSARIVGWAVHDPPSELNLPCHRVVNRVGVLSGGVYFGHPDVMRALLEGEGISFVDEYQVDMEQHFWDPSAATHEVGDFDDVPF